jgi:hypothetical protein
MAQIRMVWARLAHGLNILRHSFDALKDPQVQPWPKLAQLIHLMLLSRPSL